MQRRFIGSLIGLAASLAIAGTVVAGGWATIVPDDVIAPTSGEPSEIGFTVMQHGQTPVSWVSPSVVVTDTATGTSRSYAAEQAGRDGHFAATITVPAAGAYTWAVTMPDLLVTTDPIEFTALAGPAAVEPAPAMDEAGAAAVAEADRLRSELTATRAVAIGLAAVLAGVVVVAIAWTLTRRRAIDGSPDQLVDAI
jgi:hypothetical protein